MTSRSNTELEIARYVLGVSQDETSKALKKKYNELCLVFHPDKYTEEKGRAHCEERFKEIQAAYNTLISSKPNLKRECEESDLHRHRADKRQRTDEKPTFFKRDKKRKIKRYFKGEWQIEFNYFYFSITSHELRLADSVVGASRQTGSDGIVFIFPAGMQDEVTKQFELEMAQGFVDVTGGMCNQVTVNIPHDNKEIFISMLEFMIDACKMDESFSLSLRAVINDAWWDDALYESTPPSQEDAGTGFR